MIWGIAVTNRPNGQVLETRMLGYDDEKKELVFQVYASGDKKVVLHGEEAALAFLACQLEELNTLVRWSNQKGYRVVPDLFPGRKEPQPNVPM